MRERPRDKGRLEHILEACDVILNALDKFGFDAILKEPIMFHGLVKQVEIIGEATYKLTKEFKSVNPEVPWRDMEDMRHVLVHDYYRIEPELMRDVVEHDIPALRPVIQKLYDNEVNIQM